MNNGLAFAGGFFFGIAFCAIILALLVKRVQRST